MLGKDLVIYYLYDVVFIVVFLLDIINPYDGGG